MKLKNATLHTGRFSLVIIPKMVFGAAMRETNWSPHQIATELAWKLRIVNAALEQEPLPDDGGPDVLSITIADIKGKSPRRARLDIENEIVRKLVLSLPGERCNRLIARMLKIGEWRIRRIRQRAGILPARTILAMRRAKEEQERRAKEEQRWRAA